MHRLAAALAVFAFAATGSAALADGATPYISQGGLGALSRDGKTRFVAVVANNSTVLERVRVADGAVLTWVSLPGFWGIPAPTSPAGEGEGVTRNGKKLIVATVGSESTQFAVLGTRYLRVLDRFTLNGNFAYDALSPDASTLYLIQHVDANNVNRYVVRAYDLNDHRLISGRIADKTQLGWVMEGSAVTRTTSSDGRWVYTLYQRPGGYPFIHALDTVAGLAHCTGLPWSGNQTPMWNIRLTLGDDGKSLAVHWKSGRPWLALNTGNWRLTHVHPGAFPWPWLLLAACGTTVLLLLMVAAVRKHPRITFRPRRGSAAPPAAVVD